MLWVASMACVRGVIPELFDASRRELRKKAAPVRAEQPFEPACVGFQLRRIAPGHQALLVLSSALLLPATPWT